jgi:two-component system, OmpR family, sensor kinase
MGRSSGRLLPEKHSLELISLRAENEELRKAIHARENFIAIAAHELRNPMQSFLGTADHALIVAHNAGADCPPRVLVLLERLKRLAEDFVKRSTALLDATRIEAGNLRLNPSVINLSELLPTIVTKYSIGAADVGTELRLDVEPGVSGMWDQLAIEEVAENLISNAIKFGAGCPVDIRLRTLDHSARLDVRDRGDGMTKDQQAHIFGRFEQVVSNRQSGYGIGLWVASRLVQAMGGSITVSSQPSEGSTCTVTFPLNTIAPAGSAA